MKMNNLGKITQRLLPLAALHRASHAVLISLVLSIAAVTTSCSAGEARTEAVKPSSQSSIRAALAFSRSAEAMEAGNWEECLKQAEAALQQDPEHVSAQMNAAWACWNLEQYDQAASHYSKVAGSLGDRARMWRAHCLAAAGRWPEAQQAFADRLATDALIYWAPYAIPGADQNDHERGVVHFKKVAKANPKSAVALWLLGNAYSGAKRWKDAETAYAEALKIAPQWAPAVLSAAMAQSESGNLEVALTSLETLLESQTNHIGALWARAQVLEKQKDVAAISKAYARFTDALGHRAGVRILVKGAQAAWAAGQIDEGIKQLNSAMLWADEYSRAKMMESDEEMLAAFAKERTLGSPTSPLGRYALASSLFGQVDTLLSWGANPMLMTSQRETLTRINKPTQADMAAYDAGSARQAQEAAQSFDLLSVMVIQWRSTLLPHLGRCVRELQAALEARPDFAAAKVLLAQIHYYAGREKIARKLLEEVLAARPEATTIRLRLSQWTPLDEAQELVENVAAQDAGLLRVMLRRATLERDARDYKASANYALAIQRVHGSYWDVYELLGLCLEKMGDRQAAYDCLEHSTKSGRTAQGALALAKLKEKLSKPGVVEALIDAWRAAPGESPEEVEARELLRRHETASYVCRRCGGGGTISETSGSTGQYGYIQTQQVLCPQCQGLGLWHSKAH